MLDGRIVRRYHRDPLGEGAHRFFRSVKEPLLAQFLVQLLKLHLQGPDPGHFHRLGVELVITTGFVDGQASPNDHPHPVFRRELNLGKGTLKHHHGKLELPIGLIVF